tara:strand:+ start:195 stop:374 length:180 start_codon:yes stop_codon:yes gene_type:complete
LCSLFTTIKEWLGEKGKEMTNQEVCEALRLLLQVWKEHGQEGCEALLAAALERRNNESR